MWGLRQLPIYTLDTSLSINRETSMCDISKSNEKFAIFSEFAYKIILWKYNLVNLGVNSKSFRNRGSWNHFYENKKVVVSWRIIFLCYDECQV